MKRKLFTSLISAVSAGLVLVASQATAAGQTSTTRASIVARAAATAMQFETVHAAVSAGKLDAAVARSFAKRGTAEAFVSFADVSARVEGSLDDGDTKRLWTTREARESLVLRFVGNGVEELTEYKTLPLAHVRIESPEALLELVNRPEVARVSAVGGGTMALDQSLGVIRQPLARAAGHTGAGTYVAVIDSGVDRTRAAFGSCTSDTTPTTCRVPKSFEFATQDSALDDNGHGTNVAGIVLGVAPGTRIISMDVFDRVCCDEYGNYVHRYSDTAVVSAVDYTRTLKSQGWNIRALNLSLGVYFTYHESACAGTIPDALARARFDGIAPVVSSGNKAVNQNGAYQRGIGYPACAGAAISVGATTDAAMWDSSACNSASAANQVTSFSQSARNLTLLAPGQCIVAAGIAMQGTSQAAPHVAGAVAVLAAAKPATSVDQIVSALTSTGPQIYDQRSGETKRRLDVKAALDFLLGSGGTTDRTAPTVTAPVESFDGPISSSGAIVKLTWSATDASGIAEYALYSRLNGGPWTKEAIAATATSARFTLPFGSKFEFAVQARDRAGNWSTHRFSPALTPGVSDDASWGQLSGWSSYGWADAFGGSGITTSQKGTSITHTFTGRDVAFIAPKFPSAGRAHVYCNGAFKGTVDLYAASMRPRETAFWCRFAQVGQHRMQVVVEGTTGRPRIDVDAFAVIQ